MDALLQRKEEKRNADGVRRGPLDHPERPLLVLVAVALPTFSERSSGPGSASEGVSSDNVRTLTLLAPSF